MLTSLLIMLVSIGCNKTGLEADDESTVVSDYPFLSVYKTKKPYFNNVMIGIDDNNEIIVIPDYNENSNNVTRTKYGQYTYKNKWLLANGYVVDKGALFPGAAVTDISLTEYVNFNEPNKLNWEGDMLKARIIDTNPYETFYRTSSLYELETEYTLGDIRKMIDNGTIEKHFEKLK